MLAFRLSSDEKIIGVHKYSKAFLSYAEIALQHYVFRQIVVRKLWKQYWHDFENKNIFEP